MKNRNKMNNNGFSLVELIIVIAIMAVLIGVLAPQYLKYVERGRESADLDNIEVLVQAVEIYNSDPNNAPVTGSIKAASGAITVTGVSNALTAAGVTPATMKSSTYADWEIEFTRDAVNVKTSTLATALGRAAATPAPAP